ncbi:MAG: 16S rRNA (cytidine(1402)-2'-O)-methyltransferase [Actinomycetota bacterium]|nr:16S rRNA (cytidine(1402)-2'-O)-methyltransferase [Actinomycetota bacterium]
MAGTLWLVGTPIGNLGDLSERTARALADADVIACEDTRRTRALLSHLGIGGGARLLSFFEGNERRRLREILAHLEGNRDVALVSDAGMPGLSDPGYRLVTACVEKGIEVDLVPGPSAAISALVLSGLPTARFSFEGFLPRKAGERRGRLAEIADDPRTLILFESPRRVGDLLRDALEILGDRRAAVARELTKVHQEVVRGRLSEILQSVGDEVRGEVVVVLEGRRPSEARDLDELGARVEALTVEGVPRKEAAARVAEESGASKRELYEASLRRRG